MSESQPAVVAPVEASVRPRAWLVEDPDPNGPRTFIATQDMEDAYSLATDEAPPIPLYDQAAIDTARMAGVHSVHEQTTVIVRAALALLEAVEGCEAFPPEKMAAFRRVFGA